MLGKIIRNIEKSDEAQLQLYISILESKLGMQENISSTIEDKKNTKKSKSNYMSDLMKKYRRGNDENM